MRLIQLANDVAEGSDLMGCGSFFLDFGRCGSGMTAVLCIEMATVEHRHQTHQQGMRCKVVRLMSSSFSHLGDHTSTKDIQFNYTDSKQTDELRNFENILKSDRGDNLHVALLGSMLQRRVPQSTLHVHLCPSIE